MATAPRKASNCAVSTGLSASDKILVLASGNNGIVNTTIFFANTNVPHVTVGNNAMSTANLVVRSSTAPSNSSSNGVQGQMVWDSGYLYVCVANNSWKRAALSTF